jgi:hypothetical protein
VPVDVQIVHGGTGCVYLYHGVLTGDDVIQLNEKILASEKFKQVQWCLVDETLATSIDISPEETKQLVKQDSRLIARFPNLVIAVVAPRDVGFGMARMWEIMTARTGWSTRTFRTRTEADAWLREEMERKFNVKLLQDLSAP